MTPLAHRLGERLATRRPVEAGVDAAWYAGVAAVLVPDPDAVLLIRRAERDGDPWSGHFGLPGGRHHPADQNLAATAIRETQEEVGLLLRPDQLLGVLDDVYPRTPLPRTVVVRPHVFFVPSRPALSLSDEVAETFWVPLEEFRQPGVYHETEMEVRGARRAYPAYHLGDRLVWGLTERILTGLLDLV